MKKKNIKASSQSLQIKKMETQKATAEVSGSQEASFCLLLFNQYPNICIVSAKKLIHQKTQIPVKGYKLLYMKIPDYKTPYPRPHISISLNNKMLG